MKKTFSFVTIVFFALLFANCKKDASFSSDNAGAGGSTAMMTTSGDYLYIVTNSNLYTHDISEPDKTVLLNSQYLSGNVETIFPYRDKLFIGSQSGMFVYDITNPKQPKLQGTAQHLRACDPVVADDNFAFVTLRNNNVVCGGTLNQLNIYDIQGNNILTPKLISSLSMPEPHGLGYKNNALYVCMGKNGLNVIDITDKTKPKIIKTINTGENFVDVIPYNNLLIVYVQGGIVLYDISDTSNPQKLSAINY